MKVTRQLIGIIVIVVLTIILIISVEGRMHSSCVCYYVGDCEYDDHHIGMRYSQCTGSCYAYSGWQREPRCVYPYKHPGDAWKALGY